jgi:putative ABC transport system permease protein
MLRITLRDLRAHVGRYVLTFFAVAIGVAFVGGVNTLTDTIGRTIDDLFAEVNAGTDAVVRAPEQFEARPGPGVARQRPRIDETLAGAVEGVDGVGAAASWVEGFARPIDREGSPYGDPRFGAPTFGGSWIAVDDLNPFVLTEGSRAPEAPDEVVFDKGTADALDYGPGDTARVETPAGVREVTVAGVARFGTADSPAGASFTLFPLDLAQEVLAEPGKVDEIAVVGDGSTTQTELRDRLASALDQTSPDTDLEVLTGEEVTERDQSDAQEGFGFLRTFLLVFALISVAVGAFVIFTSFSFIVAQRQRQIALLRAVGASRRQVLSSIIVESLVVGIAASVLGYVAGVGLAWGLPTIIDADLAGLAIVPASVMAGLVVGVAVTAGSAFFPAWRASRVPPVAAMRDVAIDTSSRSRGRLVVGLAVLALGAIALGFGITDRELAGYSPIMVSGAGIFCVFAALVILGPVAARPAATVLGSPLPVLRGVVGRLAQQNAVRNPKRTSSTGAALMIGLGIVSLFLVINASVRSTIDDVVDNRFTGDFVVDSGTGVVGGGLDSRVAREINDLSEVEAATGLRIGRATIDDELQGIGGVDPTTAFELFDVGITAGDPGALDADGLAVFEGTAESEGWTVGDTVPVTFAETGEQELTIVALLETRLGVGGFLMGTEAFDANLPDTSDNQIWIRLSEGASRERASEALEAAVADYPSAEVQDLDEFKSATKAIFDPILILVNVLLALTILIAMIGIVNTLVLSVIERTREIGLTRAVGASRGQIRATIRWEALVIAVFGLVAALAVGVFFGWVIVTALAEQGLTAFRVPVLQLVAVTVITALLTLLAALFPALWAGRRKILAAIAVE